MSKQRRELQINESQERSSYRYKAVRQSSERIRVCTCGSNENWVDCYGLAGDWSYCG